MVIWSLIQDNTHTRSLYAERLHTRATIRTMMEESVSRVSFVWIEVRVFSEKYVIDFMGHRFHFRFRWICKLTRKIAFHLQKIGFSEVHLFNIDCNGVPAKWHTVPLSLCMECVCVFQGRCISLSIYSKRTSVAGYTHVALDDTMTQWIVCIQFHFGWRRSCCLRLL